MRDEWYARKGDLMPSNEESIGYEREDDPKNAFTPVSYRVKYRCKRCGHEYSRIQKSLSAPDVPCPKQECKDAIQAEMIERAVANRMAILESRQMPGVIGMNEKVKVVDMTAAMVMEQGGHTDLKDNLREGDTMVPSLPPPLQKQVDGFFSGKPDGISKARAKRLTDNALRGQYRNMAVSPADVFSGQKGSAVTHTPVRRPN